MSLGSWKTLAAAAAVGLAAFAAACGPRAVAPPVADLATTVTTTLGQTVGFTAENGARVWRGLPYAAPPVGDLRWRAPRPAAPWEGVRESLEHPAWCAQLTNRLDEGYGLKPGTVAGSEDCLYLNVYAPPESASDAPAPVMVWIHGGANVWGRIESYDAAMLAARENVVVVTIQYRLGPFGFLSHPALRATAETPDDRAANFAILDQVAALKWVRDNAAAFGGDPDRVTIFGESAGGHDVAALLVTPQAQGLFQRAIMESGLTITEPRRYAEANDNVPGRDLNPSGLAVRTLLGDEADGLSRPALADRLRALPADDVVAAFLGEGVFVELPRLIEDGVTIPEGGMGPALAQVSVPLMTGTNRDETRLFNFLDPTQVANFAKLRYWARDPAAYDVRSDYESLFWRLHAVDDVARAIDGAAPVYAYRFDWDDEGSALFSDFSQLLGAGHSIEIPFVFADWSFGGRLGKILYNKKNRTGREAVSDAMMSYWAAFARDGAPGRGADGAHPEWTPWRPDGVAVMAFDAPADGGVRMAYEAETAASAIAAMRADPRLADEAAFCAVYASAASWFPMAALGAPAPAGCAVPERLRTRLDERAG